MWPAKSGLGVQLTYGVSGNAVVDRDSHSDSSTAARLKFPRAKNEAAPLHEIKHSSRRLKETKCGGASEPQLRTPQMPLSVSDSLIKATSADSEPFHRGMGHDPSIGKLSITFDLGIGEYTEASKHSKPTLMSICCVACVDGADSILICPLLPKIKNVLHVSNPAESRKSICAVPTENYAAKHKCSFQIQQIERCGELLAVRNGNEILFLNVWWSNSPNEKGLIIDKAFMVTFSTAPLLHFQANGNRFVVINTKRQCITYSFWKDSKWKFKKISSKQLPERNPFDLSDFIRLHWPDDSDQIVVFERKSVYGISLSSDEVKKYVNFHNWSHLLDFQLICPELFILTSQEIIWLRYTESVGLERLLSWKHYLDPTDYSFKMTLHLREKDNIIMCLIYSSNSPIIIHYSFALRGNKPYSVRDPYYVHSRLAGIKHISVCSSAFENDDYLFNYFQIGVRNDSNYMALSFHENLAFRNHSTDSPGTGNSMPTPSRSIPLVFTNQEESFILHQLRHSQSKEIAEEPPQNHTSELPESQSSSSSSQVDMVQNFALELGSDIKNTFSSTLESKAMPSFKSLANIAKDVPTTVVDLTEFDSMLQQLEAFYDSHDVKLNRGDSRIVKQLLSLDPTTSENFTESLHTALESYEHDPKILKAAVILASSIIKANSRNFSKEYDSKIRDEAASHDSEYRELFSEWQLSEIPESKSRHIPSGHHAGHGSNSLLKQALTQNSQAASQLQSTSLSEQHSQPVALDSSIDEEVQVPSSQPLASSSQPSVLEPPSVSQTGVQSSQPTHSQPKSQPKVQLKRLGSQNPSQRRKKKKGGFS